MTPPEVIARLKELEAKATPAPLKHRWESDGQKPDRYFAHGTHLIETVRDNQVIDNMNVAIMQRLGPQETAANAELFVMLRNAARSLISDSERLAAAEARVRELEEAVTLLGTEARAWREYAEDTHDQNYGFCRPGCSKCEGKHLSWNASKNTDANQIARAAVAQKEVE